MQGDKGNVVRPLRKLHQEVIVCRIEHLNMRVSGFCQSRHDILARRERDIPFIGYTTCEHCHAQLIRLILRHCRLPFLVFFLPPHQRA